MAQTMNEHTINWQAVGEETIARTQDLLRLDTRNPPGNIHSHDERVSTRSLYWGVRVLYEVVERFASSL